jgi:hypothetical protein
LRDTAEAADIPPPHEAELSELVLTAPMMAGAEYLTQTVLRDLWVDIGRALSDALAGAGGDVQAVLKSLNPAWKLVGRVHFNLAENRRDAEAPFAFMATYTTELSAQGRARHVPLGQALRDYAGAANREKLLALLAPVQRAAASCEWLRPLVDAGGGAGFEHGRDGVTRCHATMADGRLMFPWPIGASRRRARPPSCARRARVSSR